MTAPAVGGTTLQRRLLGRGVLLEAATVGWNVIEAGVALIAGLVAGSGALVGFGLDSGIEVFAAGLVIARLRATLRDGEPDEDRERRALRNIAVSFYALTGYLLLGGVVALATGSRPETSPVGIAVTAAAALVMPVLAVTKRRVGRSAGNDLLIAEASESLLCASLSITTLLALLLFSTFGWAWADPVAGFVIAAFAIREGREAWAGGLCCA